MPDVHALWNQVFGCCLGRRRHDLTADGLSVDHAENVNENTPLLHNRDGVGKSAAGRLNRGEHESSNDAASKEARQKAGSSDTLPLSLGRRRRQINASVLQAVQDRANIAYFNIDSSQLLPSSSSVAQRRAAMGSSQRLSRRDHQVGDANTSAQRGRDPVAASDQAERLYTAAMKTEASTLATSSKDDAESGSTLNRSSPISLVRQIRLSVYDAGQTRSAAEQRSPSRPDLVSNDSAQTAKRLTTELQVSISASPSQDSAIQHLSVRHTPSIHSLRTLRLGVANDEVEESQHSDDHRLRARHSDEEDEWQRRGRTRSRRGLVWMEARGRTDQIGGQQKGQMEDVFRSTQQQSEEGQNTQNTNTDEIHNAVRLESHANERRRNLIEQLRSSTQAHVSEMWDEPGNVSSTAAEIQ